MNGNMNVKYIRFSYIHDFSPDMDIMYPFLKHILINMSCQGEGWELYFTLNKLGVFAQQEIRNLFHNPQLTKFMM